MKRVGRKVVLITIGSQDTVSSNGLTTYNVSDDIGWEKWNYELRDKTMKLFSSVDSGISY